MGLIRVGKLRPGDRYRMGARAVRVVATSPSSKVPDGVLVRFAWPDGRVDERHYSRRRHLDRV